MQIKLLEFMNLEKMSEGEKDGCNMEINLESSNLPTFSNERNSYFYFEQFTNFLNTEDELVEEIVSSESNITNLNKSFEVEYVYINFNMMIIGEKIRCIFENEEIPRFDNLFYAELIAKLTENEDNDVYFSVSSIKKIIDSQWVYTYRFQLAMFLMYLTLYCVPMFIVSF